MLTQIPPWLDVSPSTFLNAAVAGAHAGQSAADALTHFNLGQQEIASHAATAANQIAAEREHANASLALQKAHAEAAKQLNLAHLSLAGDRLSSLNDYREKSNALKSQALDLRENSLFQKGGQPVHLGNKLVKIDENGNPIVLFDADSSRVKELDRMKYNDLLKQKREAEGTLSKGGLSAKDSAYWKTRLDGAMQGIQEIEGRYPSSATSAAAPPADLSGFRPPPETIPGLPVDPNAAPPNAWESLISPQSSTLTAPPYLRTPNADNDPLGILK